MTDFAGRFHGRFTDASPIAQGAEGMLVRVHDRWAGRVCALKTASDPAGESALRHEYRLLSRLRHPCLLRSLDLVRDEQGAGHLVEYVPAVDPARLWEEGGEPAVAAALVQALRGLAYLHRHGWVHADVSPGNVLVWREGDRWRARIADLGLSVPCTGAGPAGLRGTPGYLAPEVARGSAAPSPASDLFSLGATAITWIDGIGFWDELTPGEALQRAAALDRPLAPRRAVGPVLRDWIAGLTDPDPACRRAPPWSELARDGSAWGEPVLESGLHGLDDAFSVWMGRAAAIARGSGLVLRLHGRAGSGRRTAAVALARNLTAEGWTALAEVPLAALRDWLAAESADPDPVRVARTLRDRFAGRDLALVWPEALSEFETRLLQAFVAGRGGPSSAERTFVIRPAPAERGELDAWLESTLPVEAVEWQIPLPGLVAMSADLFPAEEGYGEAEGKPVPDPRAGETPLSLVLRKRAAREGRSSAVVEQGVEAVRAEVDRLWRRLPAWGREGIALLAASRDGWPEEGLGRALDWPPEETAGRAAALRETAIVRVEYEEGAGRLRAADWMVRAAVAATARGAIDLEAISTVAERVEADAELHPGDLDLASAFAEHGILPTRYAIEALEAALAGGRFEAVLRYRGALQRGGATGGDPAALRERFLRAAARLGRFETEIEILRETLLARLPASREYEVRAALARCLFAVGNWQAAVAECAAMRDLPGLDDARQTRADLERAEILWQAGRVDEAEEVYTRAAAALPEDARDLWLKYALGMARLSASRDRMPRAWEFIELGIARAGAGRCEADPLFVNTRAGLLQAMRSSAEAAEDSERAVRAAQSGSDWHVYVMAASRLASTRAAQGRYRLAHRLASDAVSTALATGSGRMAALAGCYLGYFDLQLGFPMEALRRGEWARRLGEKTEELRLVENGLQMTAEVAGWYGFSDLLEEAIASLRAASADPRQVTVAYASAADRLNHLDYGGASGHVSDLSAATTDGAMEDVRLEAEAFRAEILLEEARREDAVALLHRTEAGASSHGLDGLARVCRLLTAAATGDGAGTSEQCIDEMLRDGQLAALCFWSYSVLRGTTAREDRETVTRVGRKLLSAFQTLGRGMEGAPYRAVWLSAPRNRRALEMLKGPF